MKQKLGLCCALVHDPDLLILDEPTTGVDPLSRRQFWEMIERIRSRREGMSVVVSTAYMEEAERFDWLVAMNAGKILSCGTPQQLKEQTGSGTLDEAFIRLLPDERSNGHRLLIVPPRLRTQDEEETAIRAESLTMRFGDFTAVDDVSFTINRGEIFGFLGSNGCGKTTTMKMLTGLLSPTEGKAWLFGEPARADDIATRRRVGYMTQSFSLYTELTVLQNLLLHARLFEIGDVDERVEVMLERFDLRPYRDSFAADLPLGIRQRLSLAVAVVHRPEMLILDEPTSGVDPISRDRFWRYLIDLSRNDGVTIFVSTHFMNEGERCDRISLMHQGKVLASDSPAALIGSRKRKNLEETFIDYLEEAYRPPPPSPLAAQPAYRGESGLLNRFFSPSRFFGYACRESLELLRDPVRLVFALLGMGLLMLILGFGITMDVEDLRFAVLDQDGTPQSRDYAQNLAGSRYFLEHPPLYSFEELDSRMKSNELSLALIIPPGFAEALTQGDAAEVAVWIDGAMPFRAETIRGYVQGMHVDYLRRLSRETLGEAPPLFAVRVESRYRYNQDFKSIYAMVPAVIPMLLIFIPSILMALSVVREKELGSITNFYATPVTRFEFFAGKQLPYIAVSMVGFLILIALALFVFDVPFKGSPWTLSAAALLYVMITTGMGFVMSAFTRTQIAALAATAIATLLPTESFSGLRDPVSSLEGPGAWIGAVFPATYFMNISRGVFSKALSYDDLTRDFAALFLALLVISWLAVVLLKKQEK